MQILQRLLYEFAFDLNFRKRKTISKLTRMHFNRRSQWTAGGTDATDTAAAAHMTRVHIQMMVVHDERRLNESATVIVQRQLVRQWAAQLRHHHRRFVHNRGTVFSRWYTEQSSEILFRAQQR